MNKRQWILGLSHSAIWVGVVLIADSIASGSPARAAYALLCAWWATLYVGLLLNTTWRAVPIFIGSMAIALAIAAAVGSDLLYHDTPSIMSAGFFGVLLLLCVLWVSPFVVNEIARRIRTVLAK